MSRYEMRMMEMQQVKKPRPKTARSEMRCDRSSFSRQRTRMGRQKMTKPGMMFPAALVYHCGMGGMHLALTPGSQAPGMGLQMKMTAKVLAKPQTQPSTVTQTVTRRIFTEKRRKYSSRTWNLMKARPAM